MDIERIVKPSFSVIGLAGSTEDGPGFIQRLWEEANARFPEAAPLAKTGPDGALSGIWGAMSDFSLSFLPWEDGFSRGLYLAGIEAREDAQPPEGWVKWTIPGFEYLKTEITGPDTFQRMIGWMEKEGISLAGAVHDYTDPATGRGYMLFPVRRL